jgi:peptidoglycan hydrolase CwlO-like protein
MEDYEIAGSVEWQAVRAKLANSKNNLRMFTNDIDRMLRAIDDEVKKLGNLEIEVRSKKSKSCINRAQEQLDLVNKQIKNFNKYYMLAMLSQSH